MVEEPFKCTFHAFLCNTCVMNYGAFCSYGSTVLLVRHRLNIHFLAVEIIQYFGFTETL
jgi:hypothetical protein